ncbi:sensor histidine kinase [Sulfurivermis fontis]|uniref:sensor histidine kinase n=1 Tax=Sulfurivermis fontis TaxID=1972068 RepID=UPI000FDC967D|nr:HAMP domain-containing sensor histidine kinase [Sulfurivermis fontis]
MVSKPTRRRSLSRLISLYAGGGLFLLASLFGFIVQQGVSTFVEGALHDKAQALARQLAVVSLDAVLMRDYGTLARYVEDLVKHRDVLYIRIRRDDGEILGQAENVAERARASHRGTVEEPIMLLHNRIGDVTVEYDSGRADAMILQLRVLGIIGIFAVTLALFVLLRNLLQRRMIRPIQQLAAQINPLSEQPPAPIPADAPQEVEQLAATFARLRSEVAEHIDQVERANQLTRAATERLCREQRLAAIGQLAAGLAHGLNTPLGNIKGYAQMARRQTADQELRERLEVIEKQAATCTGIVSSLLTAAHQPNPVGQRVDLAALARDVVQLTRPLMQERGVENVAVEGDAQVPAWADPAALEHVLFNLLSNATHAGCTALILRAYSEDGLAWLEVEDNGPGIPETMHDTLFEPFVSSKPAGEGTGLGLYLCMTLLHAMQGGICLAESRPGRTLFRLRLPMDNPQPGQPLPESEKITSCLTRS